MKITRTRIIIIIILLLLVTGGWYWFSNRNGNVVMLEQVQVEEIDVRETVSADGEITSENYADLSFSATGEIESINVSEGDKVEKNQILASLNSYSVSQSAQAAKDARDIALRDKDLFLEQYADDKDEIGGEDEFEIRLRRLNEQISQAEANYQSQLANLNDLNIRAPFSGTVVDIIKKEGQNASLGETIIKVADLNQLYFELNLDQEDFGKINVGDSAEIELDTYSDETFAGEIFELPQYINPDEGTQLPIKIQLEAVEDKPILLGMGGDGTIVTEESEGTVKALPFDAVFTESNGSAYIWVLEEGIVRKKQVQTGIVGDIYTQVLDNLENDTIVIPAEVNTEISEGDAGKVVPE